MKSKLLKDAPVIGFTGRICAGKDYVAGLGSLQSASMAEPLYKLSELFWDLGASARDRRPEGLREFWQAVGQWGKGIVSPKYPVTPERAAFEAFVREKADQLLVRRFGTNFEVAWDTYGQNPAIWADALLVRLAKQPPGLRFGVTNLRFQVEIDPFVARQWPIVHVTASPATLRARQEAQGIRPGATEDISEAYATQVDALIGDICGRSYATPPVVDWLEDNGFPHCAVVWNDPAVEIPAFGMLLPESFRRLL